MKIGKRIKQAYGICNDVEFVMFEETKEHLVLMIVPYDMTITHKQVNAVLNQYPLGDKKDRWIFIDTSPGKVHLNKYKYRSEMQEFLNIDFILISRYRVDKKTAMKALKAQELKLAEEADHKATLEAMEEE